jgi:hypothetical protein
MKSPLVTLSPEELFAISLELCSRLHKATMPKQVLNKIVSTHMLIEQVPDEVSSSVNNKTNFIQSPEQSTLLSIYLSTCDLLDPKLLTFYNTAHTLANSLTFTSDHPAPYTDLFLSTKEKYKPIVKTVHPIIRELPDKFCIVHKIIGNPPDNLPVLYPDSPPFITTDFYTLERQHQSNKNHLGSFWWPTERDLMHHFILHASSFAWHEEERGSFRAHFLLLVNFPILCGWTITSPFLPDTIDIDDTCLQEMKHSLDTDGDDENTYHNLTDNLIK